MRTLRVYAQQLSHKMNSSANYIHHVVHYIPSTYLSCNWKFLPLEYTFIQFPSPQALSLVTINLNSFSVSLSFKYN